jgi:hypothetical protein
MDMQKSKNKMAALFSLIESSGGQKYTSTPHLLSRKTYILNKKQKNDGMQFKASHV